MLPLSQGHLKLLDTCGRKYQHVFFDALSGPATYDQQLTTQWGSQFHLLMQQRALDLPVEVLAGANADMAASMNALAQAAPEVFEYLSAATTDTPDARNADMDVLTAEASPERQLTGAFSQSEHRRTLAFNDYLLTVVYDLVVCTSQQGQIFDWKTHQRRPLESWLQDDWQTRLYLYVLCETTDLRPDQLSMTYWFVRLVTASEAAVNNSAESDDSAGGHADGDAQADNQLSFSRFSYSAAQHQRTQKDLQRLTNDLSEMRTRGEFPKVAIEKGLCDCCLFNVRCDRLSNPSVPPLAPTAPQPSDPIRLLREVSQLTPDLVDEIPL